ncbi:hypothetical protein ACI2I2_06625 [Scandinavium sp. NPDC088450]|uniref:hypothetical protein n=1 Tax=Scandinavium sp. NPDC088450 TaxID=3364514 RepID=UPI00384A9E07
MTFSEILPDDFVLVSHASPGQSLKVEAIFSRTKTHHIGFSGRWCCSPLKPPS